MRCFWGAPLGRLTSAGRQVLDCPNVSAGAASGARLPVPPSTSHPSWSSRSHYTPESDQAHPVGRQRAVAASRGRAAGGAAAAAGAPANDDGNDDGEVAAKAEPSTSGRVGRGGSSSAEVRQKQSKQRAPPRRPFGPDPPPAPPGPGAVTPGAEAAAAGPSGSSPTSPGGPPGAAAAPKRRGRPPKARPATIADNRLQSPQTQQQQQQQQQQAPSLTSDSVPLAEAAAEIAAAAAASASAAPDNSTRRPFGPEPPPPSELTDPAAAAESGPSFALPYDPAQLNVDDILDLPLPDPRVGEGFRLDGDLTDLGDLSALGELGEAAAELAASAADSAGEASGDHEDPNLDLDYDQLIALGSRVNAANYVARAFERAKQGVDPIADSKDVDVEVEPSARRAASPYPPTQTQTQTQASKMEAGAAAAETPGAKTSAGGGGGGRDAARVTARDGGLDAAPSGARPGVVGGGAAAVPFAPPRPRGEAVYVEEEEEEEEEEEDAPADGDGSEKVDSQEEAAGQRRVALLVDLLSATGAELEAKLEAAAPEVDSQLLVLLERRYTAALAMRQSPAETERIAALYRALRYVYERRTSSPAERLLDDVLGILADTQLQPDPARRRGEAAARLRNAFTGGMLDVDVFTAAAALAEGRQAAAEALAGEQVSLESFKAEAMGLLDHARRVQEETLSSLETIEAEVARLRSQDPAALEGREWRVRMEQVRLARQALTEREESMGALEEVLALTRAVELQMLTGRWG